MRRSGFGVVVATAGILAACASSPPGPTPQGTAPSAAKLDPHCIRVTGTRIAVPEGRCVPSPGFVLTPEELQRSGQTDLHEAVRSLLPY